MKQRKRVAKKKTARPKPARRKMVQSKSRGKTISLQAVAESPSITRENLEKWYRVRKEPVTLRLDVDIVAWFKRDGRGYQTRINRALRAVVKREQKEAQ
jgi:uncharacterized protein (DUF4415 family)